jgi:hypothetical protein
MAPIAVGPLAVFAVLPRIISERPSVVGGNPRLPKGRGSEKQQTARCSFAVSRHAIAGSKLGSIFDETHVRNNAMRSHLCQFDKCHFIYDFAAGAQRRGASGR